MKAAACEVLVGTIQCKRGNTKVVIGARRLSLAGAEFLQTRGELLRPRLESVIDIVPVVERVLGHGGGAAALVDGLPQQTPVRRVFRMALAVALPAKYPTPLLKASDASP